VIRRSCILGLLAAACGGADEFTFEGTAGTPTPASFGGLVPTIHASIDGVEREFLLDTGAPMTILDTTSLDVEAGKAPHTVDAFGLTVHEYPTVAWDLFPGNDLGGIIGGDFLRHFAFSLDYRGGRAWVGDPFDATNVPADLDAADLIDVPIEVLGGGLGALPGGNVVALAPTRVMVQVLLEGKTEPVWALVDSGASAVVVDETLLDELGDAAGRPRLDGVPVTTVSGVVDAFLSRLAHVEMAGSSLDDVPILVVPGSDLLTQLSQEVDLDVRVLIGGSLLRHFWTTFDYPGGFLRLGPYRTTPHIDPLEWVSIGAELYSDGPTWRVRLVYPGTDAAADGLVEDDVVEEIGGMPITGQSPEVVGELLDGYSLGEDVPIGVARDTLVTLQVRVEDLLPSYDGP
jgi:hypothetical protein